ncbi:unnamed protein product [Bursaphelenchus xylophilus]|nr:unnamed protein product [Bursaphelenchus xylophilus]CAG9122997.1 unnamed protein product [Bursaphelenchus xylophilus]
MDSEPAAKKIRLPKKAEKVKNKAAAPLQITAEQLLREAKERELEIAPQPPKVNVTDPEELAEFQRKKRKEFEDNIRKNRMQIANWVKYAKWEESIGEIQRARSVFERGLDVDHRSITLWLQYAEMEMRNRQINHARNIWDRAVTILPRATQFWLKYSYMEELVENVPGARQVFERWMEWEPNEQAWRTYINFEVRYKEIDRAREIYQRFLHVHGHDFTNWIAYAKFEERYDYIENSRNVYEQAVEFFEGDLDEKLLIAFAQFEERQKEMERARAIYQYGLDHLPNERTAELFKCLNLHEKKYGSQMRIESVLFSKRKHQYEQLVKENPLNYDNWFDYLKLLMNENLEREVVEDTFERAIANIPPYQEKTYWRRYIWLWLYYAVYEELHAKDSEKTRQVYKAALDIIPHRQFTFAKVWIMLAHFELRQLEVTAARKVMGTALGVCRPKKKIYKAYIEMEINLREFDRCRKLYEKFLSHFETDSLVWREYSRLENQLGEVDRARGILELGIQQEDLDIPEVLWKAFIDFEIEQEQYERVRQLYEVLLGRTNHIKVWLSWTAFEVGINEVEKARGVFERANKALEGNGAEERLMLLENWKEFEVEHGDQETQETVQKYMPKKVKKRRQLHTADGADAGVEEYFDYIFPQDSMLRMSRKLFEAAKLYKQRTAQINQTDEDTLDKDAERPSTTANEGQEKEKEEEEGENEEKKDEGAQDDDDSSSSDEHDRPAQRRERKSDS